MSRPLWQLLLGVFEDQEPHALRRRRQRSPGCRRGRPTVETLEDRCLPSGGISEFLVPTTDSRPFEITPGPDGNLWFTEELGNKIGRITQAGVVTEFSVPTADARPSGITAGPDGNIWFTEYATNKIGRVNLGDAITISEFDDLTANSGPVEITTGPDNNLWFSEYGGPDHVGNPSAIGQLSTNGTVLSELSLSAGSSPGSILTGPDGNLWFVEFHGSKIGTITSDGVKEFSIGGDSGPSGMTVGSDSNLWFAEQGTNNIGKITTDGTITEVSVPITDSHPYGITAGPDGNLWFTEGMANKLGRITTAGAVSEFTVHPAGTSPYGISGITVGPDSDLWFAEGDSYQIGKLYLLSATGTTLNETAGQKFADVEASFHDDQPGMGATNYTALIDWGDGSANSMGSVSDNGDGTWNVTGSHTYDVVGSYSISVTITDTHQGGMTATVTSTAHVGDGGGGGFGPRVQRTGSAVSAHASTAFLPAVLALDPGTLRVLGLLPVPQAASAPSGNAPSLTDNGRAQDVFFSARPSDGATLSLMPTYQVACSLAGLSDVPRHHPVDLLFATLSESAYGGM